MRLSCFAAGEFGRCEWRWSGLLEGFRSSFGGVNRSVSRVLSSEIVLLRTLHLLLLLWGVSEQQAEAGRQADRQAGSEYFNEKEALEKFEKLVILFC
jgi:hypothetical protein